MTWFFFSKKLNCYRFKINLFTEKSQIYNRFKNLSNRKGGAPRGRFSKKNTEDRMTIEQVGGRMKRGFFSSQIKICRQTFNYPTNSTFSFCE